MEKQDRLVLILSRMVNVSVEKKYWNKKKASIFFSKLIELRRKLEIPRNEPNEIREFSHIIIVVPLASDYDGTYDDGFDPVAYLWSPSPPPDKHNY